MTCPPEQKVCRHLAIDAIGAKYGGSASVLQEVLRAAIELEQLQRITVFCSPRPLRRFDLPVSRKLQEIEKERIERGRLTRLEWFGAGLIDATRRSGATRLLCLSGGGRAPPNIPLTTFIQQPVPFSVEALRRCSLSLQVRMVAIRAAMYDSCRRARRVIVQTPSMQLQVAEAFSIPFARIQVVSPGPSQLPEITDLAVALKPMDDVPRGCRILYVGSDVCYKNLDILIAALAAVRREIARATVFVTLPPDHVVAKATGVVGLGYLDPRTLRGAYERADVLIMPSIAETVGLPMLEAMSVGTPVLAADRPYAHDVCEEAALYFDPNQPASCARQVIRILRDIQLRDKLRDLGRIVIASRPVREAYRRMIQIATA